MLNYQVENSGGSSGVFTPDDITAQLSSMGEMPKGVSPDGQMITLSDAQQGDYQVKTEDLLRDLGWKVNAIEPSDVIDDFVKPELRVAVANLGSDDQTKKLYLQEKLRDMGLDQANIVGQGTDFYVWHPESNKYFALTNKRGMDLSDVASGISQAPGFIGGAAGGAAGALGGFGIGSIPLAMAGGAAGQLGGDVLARGALAAYDPTFRKIAGENLGQQASDLAGNALISGGTAGVFKALPMAVGAMRGAGSQAPGMIKGALESGPVSSVVRGLGKGAEETGRVASTISKPFMNRGLAQDFATSQMPIAGPIQGAGLALQAPGGLARLIAKVYGKFGGKGGQEFVQGMERDAAGDLPLGRLFEKAGQTYGSKTRLGPRGIADYRAGRQAGLEAEEALHSARLNRGATYGEQGRKIGDVVERASQYGQKLDEGASAITGGVAKGVYGMSRAVQGLGAAANRTARAAAPLENRLYAKYGAEELGLDRTFDDYLRRRKTPINSQLANTYD